MNQTKPFIAALLCALSFNAAAITSDILQEVKIDASRQFADIKNKQVTYYGPVIVTQGSIVIKADELTAVSKANGTVLTAYGKPATYSQIVEGNRRATASAKSIEYNINSRTMTLTGDATIEQDGSQVSAEMIRYDIQRQQLIAESEGENDGRVITIIKPENYQDATKAPAVGQSKDTVKKEQPQP